MLVKHSSVEFGIKWWFLHDVRLDGATAKEISKMNYDDLRQTKACVLVKRFESEAELDMEATVKYGVTPIAVADGRFNAVRPAETARGGLNMDKNTEEKMYNIIKNFQKNPKTKIINCLIETLEAELEKRHVKRKNEK